MSQKESVEQIQIHEENVPFWALIGPSFLIMISSLLLFKYSTEDFFLITLGYVGGIISWKWRMRGLLAILGALAATLCWFFFRSPEWKIPEVLILAFLCTFFIMALSSQEALHFLQTLKEEGIKKGQELEHSQKELEIFKKESQSEKLSLEREVERLGTAIKEIEAKSALEKEQLLQEGKGWFDALNELRGNHYQLSLLYDELLQENRGEEEGLLFRDNCALREQVILLEEAISSLEELIAFSMPRQPKKKPKINPEATLVK